MKAYSSGWKMIKPGREFYHTLDDYLEKGLEPFLEQAKQFLQAERTVPVCRVNSFNGVPPVTFTFSAPLLRQFVAGREVLEKPYDAAIRYGFRGHSWGGKNGIFYQAARDRTMQRETSRLVRVHQSDVRQDLDLGEEGLDSLKKVKIVHHDPSGQRVVGVYNTFNQRIIFLDFAFY